MSGPNRSYPDTVQHNGPGPAVWSKTQVQTNADRGLDRSS